MITSLSLKNFASYDSTGVTFDNLQKVNFIYGANGCGKTTLSKYLTDTSANRFISCSIDWQGDQPLDTLVYNKLFREKNLGETDIPGVFTLGEATNEQIQEIEAKQEVLRVHRNNKRQQGSSLEALQDQLEAAEVEFTDAAWDLYKTHESVLKEALRGFFGSKKSFKEKLHTEFKLGRTASIDYATLTSRAETLLGDRPARIEVLPNIDSALLHDIETHDIWRENIVGSSDVDIAELIDRLGISDWVKSGIPNIESNTCPFCQKETIDDNFREQIEAYFDDNYLAKVNSIKHLKAEYTQKASGILATLNSISQKAEAHPNLPLEVEQLKAHQKTFDALLQKNWVQITTKENKTSNQVDIEETQSVLEGISQLILQCNEEVSRHNQLVSNYDQELTTFKEQAWAFLCDQKNADLGAYERKTTGLFTGIARLNSQFDTTNDAITTLESEIRELNANVTSVQPTVDEINRSLKFYGFNNFEIVPSATDNHYCVKREDGEIANNSLSEGEMTFITFLYYYQLAKGGLSSGEVSNDRVLVIDDPISSLDSNILYVVSALTKNLTKQAKSGESAIKQVFLLTHNVYFHKEASYLGGRSNGCRDTHFWILRKGDRYTSQEPYEQDNPIESSYQLLWREIREGNSSSDLTIQNTMRRILENYFKILGKYSDDYLIEKFETAEEQRICASLMHWINDGSHTLPDALYIQSHDSERVQYLAVFEKVFTHTGHEAHFQMMMQIDPDSSSANEAEIDIESAEEELATSPV